MMHPAFMVLILVATPMFSWLIWTTGIPAYIVQIWSRYIMGSDNTFFVLVRFVALLFVVMLLILNDGLPDKGILVALILWYFLKRRGELEREEIEGKRPWEGANLLRKFSSKRKTSKHPEA